MYFRRKTNSKFEYFMYGKLVVGKLYQFDWRKYARNTFFRRKSFGPTLADEQKFAMEMIMETIVCTQTVIKTMETTTNTSFVIT